MTSWMLSAPGLEPEEARQRSPVLKSLILPGWGELDMNFPARSRGFFTSEFVLWTLTIGSYAVHAKGVDYYQSLASEHAGVDPAFKDYQYWVDIGNYASLDEFNDEHLRWRETDRIYPRDGSWNWTWDTESNRKKYDRSRVTADRWLLTGKFLVGGLVLNHLVSAIDVFYLRNKYSTRLSFSAQPPTPTQPWNYQVSVWF